MIKLESVILTIVLSFVLATCGWVSYLGTIALQEPPVPVTLPAQHEGMPDHCSNAPKAKPPHKCECKKTPGVGCEVEDSKCKVYCQKHKCYCYHKGCFDH